MRLVNLHVILFVVCLTILSLIGCDKGDSNKIAQTDHHAIHVTDIIDSSVTVVPETETETETETDAETETPEAVKKEASSVVEKALSHKGERIIRFILSSDAHQDNSNELITKGTIELGLAQREILKLMDVDFVASLGDYAWGSYQNTVTEVVEQIEAYKKHTAIEGVCQFWCEGNHDDGNYSLKNHPDSTRLNESDLYSLLYSANSDAIYDKDHATEGYFYKDFPHLKVRLIFLNTEQGDGDGGFMEEHQLVWFAETALNMSGKADWNVITLAHHPLDYGMASIIRDCTSILEAFIQGTTLDHTTRAGTKISVDYSNNNSQYVGHFHGHTHCFTVLPILKQRSGIQSEIGAYEIGIPNACYFRNNQNLGNSNPNIARFSTDITYNKSDEDGKRTSFSVVTICLDERIIYVDNYGVGIDREIAF